MLLQSMAGHPIIHMRVRRLLRDAARRSGRAASGRIKSMQQIQRIRGVIHEVDAARGVVSQPEERTRTRRRSAAVDQLLATLYSFRAELEDVAIPTIDGDHVTAGDDDETQRRIEACA